MSGRDLTLTETVAFVEQERTAWAERAVKAEAALQEVRHAFLKEDISREKVELLREYPEPPPAFSKSVTINDPPAYAHVNVVEHNRIVRALKVIAEKVCLP